MGAIKTIGAVLVTMGAHFKGYGALPVLSPLYAIGAWVLFDLLYLYGRRLWQIFGVFGCGWRCGRA